MLRLGLEIADRAVGVLPSRMAYALADLAGDAWYRLAPERRRLVAANLARVCAATGRPTGGRPFRQLVRSAFRNHARYYVELLRAPHYPAGRMDEIVEVPGWEAFAAALRGGPGMFIGSHLGNFEPFGGFLAAHGIRPLVPAEEIEPPALFEFLASRRGGRGIELVPLSRARRPISERLRAGGTVGIIGDRDLAGDGHPVTMFGHPTTVPLGPAALAVAHRAALIVGRCLRIGPDRFRAEGDLLEVPSTDDRRADAAALATRIAARFERDIGDAPEQWWGAFQPFWPDLRGEALS
jgi:KDO2-lipid IV(A) lauroyltransferase